MSGPGRWQILDTPTPAVLVATLYNFDTGSFALKPEHIQFLADHVLQRINPNTLSIEVRGRASHLGRRPSNLALSERRMMSVIEYLRAHGADAVVASGRTNLSGIATGENGFSFGTGPDDDDERDRAVEIRVLLGRPAPRARTRPAVRAGTPPVRPRHGFLAGQRFCLRVYAAASMGFRPFGIPWRNPVSVGSDQVFIQILDPLNRIVAWYSYTGINGNIGPQAGLTSPHAAPWNRFQTSHPMAVSQFGGAARFGGIGATVGRWSVGRSYFVMMGPLLNCGISTIVIDPLQTGSGLNAGLSVGVGEMSLTGTSPATAADMASCR